MKKEKDFQLLYLVQFVLALFVVLVHSGSVTDNHELHFFLKNVVARIAVPFFVINNAFFYARTNEIGKKGWFKRNISSYLLWSLVYLPFGIQFLQDHISLPVYLYPLAILFGVCYTGIFYHLWYFPAIFLGLWLIKKAISRWGYLSSFLGLLMLYTIGASETYSSYLANTFIGPWLDKYFTIFLTTRNGLFFTGIFILIGFYIAENHDKPSQMKTKIYSGLILSSCLFLIEGILIFNNQGKDVNFYFSLIPFSFFLFLLLLNYQGQTSFKYLKKYGQGIFFFHMIPIQLYNIFISTEGLLKPEIGLQRLILGVGVSVLFVYLSNKLSNRQNSKASIPKLVN